jgi:lipopolysaccharide export LptBFGC system permease protein LptF
LTARQTARGIGIRLAILVIGLLFLGFWLLSFAFKIAGALVHLFLWIGLLLVIAGAVAVLVHKIRRR